MPIREVTVMCNKVADGFCGHPNCIHTKPTHINTTKQEGATVIATLHCEFINNVCHLVTNFDQRETGDPNVMFKAKRGLYGL